MTSDQIEYVLEKNGYAMDEWTDLAKFGMIFLDQDGKLITDSKAIRFKFNSSKKYLEIAEGETNSLGIFRNFFGEKSDFTPSDYYSFDIIIGFVRTTMRTYGVLTYNNEINFQQVKNRGMK